MTGKLSVLILLSNIIVLHVFGQISQSRDSYKSFINQHPYSNQAHLTKSELKKIPKKDRPDLAWQQNFLMTLDPALGYPPESRLITAYQITDSIRKRIFPGRTGIKGVSWEERGPDNVGGRTRALMFDPNDVSHKKVWAGGVTGGLWSNTDITSSSTKWQKVNDFWDNIAVSCIAYDPNNTQIFYVGTGEGFTAGASSSVRGAGVWKTTDGGKSWSQLSATTGYYYVNDLVVRNENGTSVLYVAVDQKYANGKWHGSPGLFRSVNGGTSFTQVIPNISSFPYSISDIEIGADNRIYCGAQNNSFGNGGGTILFSDNGTSWTLSKRFNTLGMDRVELACAPSDSSFIYGVFEKNQKIGAIAYSKNKGLNWTILKKPIDADTGIDSSDFSRNQAWYDLIIAVDPNDHTKILVGAIDLFYSSDSGSTWQQVSHWYGGFSYPEVHADQHAIVFQPGSSSNVIFGNDGGVYYSNNIGSGSSSFGMRNNGYNVTQFYSCALNPTSGSNNFIGGCQDNGTQKFTQSGVNSTTEITGGDGCFAFIDQDNPDYQISSYVYNNYYLTGNNWANQFSISSDSKTGSFVNVADYDSRENILFSARNATSIQRIKNITSNPGTPDSINVQLGAMASAIKVSPYAGSGTTKLFVGTRAGDLFEISNAHSSSPTLKNIGSGSFPTGNISSIDIGSSEKELLVTFSNYGINSVFETTDGGQTWKSKEGNLPDMPVRWCLYNPDNTNEVLLATEVGVWSTTDVKANSPDWTPTNSGLANVRVDMLKYRSSDKTVLAATHGRGMFSFIFPTSSINADFIADTVCSGVDTRLISTSVSSNNIDSFLWDFNNDGLFAEATGDSIFYNFSKTDSIKVGLKIVSGQLQDSIYKYVYFKAVPTSSFSIKDSLICLSDTAFFSNSSTPAGKLSFLWYFDDGDTSSTADPKHKYANTGTYKVKLVSVLANSCTDTIAKTLWVSGSSNASFIINDSVQCLNENKFQLINNSTSCASVIETKWDTNSDAKFDNGTGDTLVFSFNAADTFAIGMMLITATDTDTVYHNVYVLPSPIADFKINNPIQSLNGNNFIFTNTSTFLGNANFPGMNYNWLFGDGMGANAKDTSHSYSKAGLYDVSLMVVAPDFCTDTIRKQVKVKMPDVAADFTFDTACFGDTVMLKNSSQILSPITSFSWALDGDKLFNDNVGDSLVQLSGLSVGVHSIGLKVTTANSSDSVFKFVTVHDMPKAAFAVNNVKQALNINNFIFTNNSTINSGTLTYAWRFGDGGTSTTKDPTYVYSAIGKYSVWLKAISDVGCIDSINKDVEVYKALNITINADFTANNTCVGDTVFLLNNSTITGDSFINFYWNYGDGYDAIIRSDHYHLYDQAGSYQIMMVALSTKGATDTTRKSVSIFNAPVFSYNLSDSTTLYKGQELELHVTGPVDSLFWSNGTNDNPLKITTSGQYAVRVFDTNHCSADTSFLINFIEAGQWRVTNVFTPNDDGVNEYFVVPELNAFKPIQLSIYNRWGELLFESTDYKNDWHGVYKGAKLPQGTYYYIARAKGRIYKGSINLVR